MEILVSKPISKYHTIKIGDVTIGGPPGSHTGLLVGSIFYDKHSLVSDAFAGAFDEAKAAAIIEKVNGLSERYGVQMAFDVIAASPEAMEKFIEFVGGRTKLPFMINASEADVHIAGLECADRLGVLNRAIFASLNEDTDDSIIEALGRHRPACVMILANDVGDPTPEGSCEMIERVFRPMLNEIKVEAPLVDLGAMDPPSVGISIRGIEAVRRRFGYPAGCAFSNCFPQVDGASRSWARMGQPLAGNGACACRAAGGDFLHYGISKRRRWPLRLGSTETLRFAAQQLTGTCRRGRSFSGPSNLEQLSERPG
uniref:Methylcobalamine:H4folate methyltransferase n=1 Tax=Hyphomicrobium sp. AT2 TaxID=717786 RepID=G0KZ28_9HYPH|nr:methylcobalamine:H4folate methyltransferase [Hyphomicrobium sp. AT2]